LNKKKSAIFLVVIFGLCVFLSPTSASANTQVTQGKYCYKLLEPTTKGSGKPSTILKDQCYASAEERAKDNPKSASNKLFGFTTQNTLNPSSTLDVHVVLAIVYMDAYYSGVNYVVDGYAGCDVYYYVSTFGSYNNQISSSHGYCNHTQNWYANQNLYPAVTPVSPANSNVGNWSFYGMNDNIESWEQVV
jgi:hypothetical protein